MLSRLRLCILYRASQYCVHKDRSSGVQAHVNLKSIEVMVFNRWSGIDDENSNSSLLRLNEYESKAKVGYRYKMPMPSMYLVNSILVILPTSLSLEGMCVCM